MELQGVKIITLLHLSKVVITEQPLQIIKI